MKLVLLRHGESEWNRKNLFTGWTDIPLSEQGKLEAKQAGKLLKENDLDFDICYTSYLKRAIDTLHIVLKEMDRQWLPEIKSWRLNEQHYGRLQGLNKSETAKRYGEEQVKNWRRSFDIRPPMLTRGSEQDPATQEMYQRITNCTLPLGESLKDVSERVFKLFSLEIAEKIVNGSRVLIVSHGNCLRALLMKFEGLSPEEIASVNVPTGIPLVCEVDDRLNLINKTYLGDPSVIEKSIGQVEAQGKISFHLE